MNAVDAELRNRLAEVSARLDAGVCEEHDIADLRDLLEKLRAGRADPLLVASVESILASLADLGFPRPKRTN